MRVTGPQAAVVIVSSLFALPLHGAESRSLTSHVVASPDTGSVVADRYRLRYYIEGEGAPALVVGFPEYYRRIFSQSLRSHLRLVFMDHRGSAPYPGPAETTEFALDRLVDDIQMVRVALGLDRVVVIGHSGHSYMALEYAKKYPEHVSHVVMIGIAPDLSFAGSQAAEEYWEHLASRERKEAMERNMREITDDEIALLPAGQRPVRSYVRDGPRLWYDPHFDSTPLWEGVSFNPEMFDYVWGTIFRDIDITRGLENFEIPVFLALGRYDFAVAPPTSWNSVRGDFRDITVRVFEKSGHTPPFEEPVLFDAELLQWLRDHP